MVSFLVLVLFVARCLYIFLTLLQIDKQRGELARELDDLSERLDEAGGATSAQVFSSFCFTFRNVFESRISFSVKCLFFIDVLSLTISFSSEIKLSFKDTMYDWNVTERYICIDHV